MKKIFSLTTEKLNLIIACSAILISLASFYATYIQANAAEKQVKAMTLPLMDFEHGNYDIAIKKKVIDLTIRNAGMGAAIIRSTKLVYKNESYDSIPSFLNGCCESEYKTYQSDIEPSVKNSSNIEEGGYLTSPINNIVVPPQSKYTFFTLYKAPIEDVFWAKLNVVRRELSVEICYCTLLGECFKSSGGALSESVLSCKV